VIHTVVARKMLKSLLEVDCQGFGVYCLTNLKDYSLPVHARGTRLVGDTGQVIELSLM